MNINIKIVDNPSPEEAMRIAELSRKTFFDTFAPSNSAEDMELFMQTQFSVENLMRETGDPQTIYVLAYADDRLAGYAMLKSHCGKEGLAANKPCELARIYVLNDYLGTGVGNTLMNSAISEARKRQHDVLWLGVWEKNERAISFYAKRGFDRFGTHLFKLGNDAQTDLLMKKSLADS